MLLSQYLDVVFLKSLQDIKVSKFDINQTYKEIFYFFEIQLFRQNIFIYLLYFSNNFKRFNIFVQMIKRQLLDVSKLWLGASIHSRRVQNTKKNGTEADPIPLAYVSSHAKTKPPRCLRKACS